MRGLTDRDLLTLIHHCPLLEQVDFLGIRNITPEACQRLVVDIYFFIFGLRLFLISDCWPSVLTCAFSMLVTVIRFHEPMLLCGEFSFLMQVSSNARTPGQMPLKILFDGSSQL
jgi:hypothetical protein